MDLIELADNIYSKKPMPRCTQRVSLIGGHTTNEQIEIVSMFIFEGIERKIMSNPGFYDAKDKQMFTKRMLLLVKLYIASLGIDMKYELCKKTTMDNIKVTRSPSFWSIKTFNFDMAIFYNMIHKKKPIMLNYNMNSKVSSMNDIIIYVKIAGDCYKITFKSY